MRKDTDRLAVQVLAESGEATKMIDALIKANPAKAAEAAEIRFQMQKQRFGALREENSVRCMAVGIENKEILQPLMNSGNKAAYLDALIDLVEKHKVAHPDFTNSEEEYLEEKKRKFIERRVDDINNDRKANLDAKKQEMSEHNNDMLAIIAIGIAATAAGATTLGVAAFATAYMLEEFSTISKDLKSAQYMVDNPNTVEKVMAAKPNKSMER